MRYMLILYGNEADDAKYAETEMPKWFAYSEELKAAGKMLGGEALMPTETATTVRQQGSDYLVTDGPFIESKEAFGGFYMIEARDMDEAMAWAKKLPHLSRGGSVEIRPIMEFDE